MQFLVAVGVVVFLIGLVQWARSGAVLWDIHRLTKHGRPTAEDPGETKAGEKETLQKSIQRMEVTMDGLLRSSLKVLGVLALCVWVFVMITVVVDMLGLDWLDRLSFSANRMIGSPTVRAGSNRAGGGSSARGDTLRSMGSGVRR